jgi:hypothetical protein
MTGDPLALTRGTVAALAFARRLPEPAGVCLAEPGRERSRIAVSADAGRSERGGRTPYRGESERAHPWKCAAPWRGA